MSEDLVTLLRRIAVAQERGAEAMEKIGDRLDLLIQAMAEDEPEDPDAQPRTYMDGSPVR
ncbi:hypothetical protein [Pseudomonas typographi]|uniref:Uncharacterized protein n=1 Tax=Pseudomonas typographi TaxID=2715964 RepID=A0ABR7Z9V9_9PSED|nr:hypothetical protein [Pseudomonas typographi]MBD1602341.1 hypothetical protein [Pseudomonas typographi]